MEKEERQAKGQAEENTPLNTTEAGAPENGAASGDAGTDGDTPDEGARLRQELDEANDKYLRLMAEFDNYRRRSAKERLELIESAGKDVLTGFLPVLDDCERAIKVLRETEASESAIEGTELIHTKILNYLKSKGVTRIEAENATFDTDFHEAVAQFPVGEAEKKNRVIEVVEQGYMLHGNVIRYAKVVVGI